MFFREFEKNRLFDYYIKNHNNHNNKLFIFKTLIKYLLIVHLEIFKKKYL